MITIRHLGDITKLNGAEIPAVDVICGGSPCQDLSVAGKRAGLAGERSGLFMDQIRIIKEMRENDRRNNGRADEFVRPRYMVWENVAGAFSSNKGEDFRAVLEETAKVADKNAYVPGLEGGRWSPCGCILGNGWSIAWRLHDAQYHGVPQRRKRICLLADFNGDTAGKILFELQRETANGDTEQAVMDIGEESRSEIQSVKESLSGNTQTSGEEGEGIAEDTERGVGETGRCLNGWDIQSKHIQPENGIAESLYAGECRCGIYKAETSRTLDLNGGSPACNQGGMAVVCLEGNGSRPSHQGDGRHEGDPMYTLNSTEHHAIAIENHPADSRVKISEDGMVQTLSSRMGTGVGNVPMVMEGINGEISGTLDASYYKGCGERQGVEREVVCVGNGQLAQAKISDKVGAQTAKGPGAVCQSVVRRLTPLECERLQGYPCGWTDIGDWVDSRGKTHKGDADSPRYKALGNSIALPFWQWMAGRMVSNLGEHPTMASLFDGISGFCLVFARAGARPVFSSEIEEFPIAVAKKHFGDDDLGLEGDYERYL